MRGVARKRCRVVYATRERQFLWEVELPFEATIADAIEAARQSEPRADIPWDSPCVGIFGERRSRADRPLDADRVEIYRPLGCDPRDRRRERVAQMRRKRPP
jgi:uncharacterized protein